jgi:hypothetical protein
VNLCYGLRFVQVSVLVSPCDAAGPARALPVRFDFAPPIWRLAILESDPKVGSMVQAATVQSISEAQWLFLRLRCGWAGIGEVVEIE